MSWESGGDQRNFWLVLLLLAACLGPLFWGMAHRGENVRARGERDWYGGTRDGGAR